MEKPKIRPINAYPVYYEGKELILISDVEGIMDSPIVVSKDIFFLMSLMDGTRTLRDLQESYFKKFASLIFTEKLNEIIDFLDKTYLIFNEKSESRLKSLKEDFELSPIRKSVHAGKSYPKEEGELIKYLEKFIDLKEDIEEVKLKGLFAPHIDYSRGGHVYGKVYRYLSSIDCNLLVLLGVSHSHVNNILNISTKDFQTPLGTIRNFFKSYPNIREDPFLKRFIEEWPHRNEHSIELQLPFLQYFLKEKDFEILPVLAGSIEDCIWDETRIKEVDEIIHEFKEVIDRFQIPYIVIAGVDLAHIGMQFGERSIDSYRLLYSRERDKIILKHIENVDPKSFFEFIKEEKNERRICGFSPLYITLSFLKGYKGKILSYDQWTDNLSSVSFASGIFYE